MAKDSLASGARTAQFSGGQAKKDDPIEFHSTVAVAEVPTGESNEVVKVEGFSKEHHEYLESLRILNDRVLIRRIEAPEGTIIQPEAYKQESPKGEVVNLAGFNGMTVGGLRIGDIVHFNEYCAEPITLDGEKLVLVDFHDIRIVLP